MQGNVGAFFSSTSWLCKCPSVIWQQVDKQPSFVSAETKQLAISEMLSVKQGVGCRVGWGGGKGWRQGIGGWGPGLDFGAFLNKISVGTPPPASTFIYLFLIYFSFLIRSRLSISHETEPKGSTITQGLNTHPGRTQNNCVGESAPSQNWVWPTKQAV